MSKKSPNSHDKVLIVIFIWNKLRISKDDSKLVCVIYWQFSEEILFAFCKWCKIQASAVSTPSIFVTLILNAAQGLLCASWLRFISTENWFKSKLFAIESSESQHNISTGTFDPPTLSIIFNSLLSRVQFMSLISMAKMKPCKVAIKLTTLFLSTC